MPLFDKNEQYTEKAIELKSEFTSLIEDFVKKKCHEHSTIEVGLCCKHVIELICCVERMKRRK